MDSVESKFYLLGLSFGRTEFVYNNLESTISIIIIQRILRLQLVCYCDYLGMFGFRQDGRSARELNYCITCITNLLVYGICSLN